MKKLALVLPLLAVATAALAQEGSTPAAPPQVVIPKVTEVDLDGAAVTAQTVGPSIAILPEPPRPGFNSLIPLRANFNDQMDQSIASVR